MPEVTIKFVLDDAAAKDALDRLQQVKQEVKSTNTSGGTSFSMPFPGSGGTKLPPTEARARTQARAAPSIVPPKGDAGSPEVEAVNALKRFKSSTLQWKGELNQTYETLLGGGLSKKASTAIISDLDKTHKASQSVEEQISDTYAALAKTGMSETDQQKTVGGVQKLGAVTKNTKGELQGAGAATNIFKGALGTLAGTVGGIVSVGAAINQAKQAIGDYINSAGTSEKTSNDWLNATRDIEQAQIDVGRAITKFVLPAYQSVAAIAKVISEGLPDLLAGKSINPQETAEKFHAADVLDRAQKMGLDEKVIYNWQIMNKDQALAQAQADVNTTNEKWKKTDDARAQGLNPDGTPLGGGPAAAARAIGMGNLRRFEGTGISGTNAEADKKAEMVDQSKSLERLNTWKQYNRQLAEMDRSTQVQQIRMKRDYDRQYQYTDDDFQKGRKRQQRDFDISLAYTDMQYQRQRGISAREFGIQMVRSEQDFQRQRAYAAKDHEFDMYQIALSGDAMSYWLAQRSYNIQQTRSKSEFDITRGRSLTDFERQRKDEQDQFDITRAQEKKMYEIQRDDSQIDFDIQRKRTKDAYELQLKDMAFNIADQKRLMDQALSDQLFATQDIGVQIAKRQADLGQTALDSLNIFYNQAMAIKNSLANAPLPAPYDPSRGYAAGGYTTPGPAEVHAGEFVMTAKTTRAAEMAAKTNALNQDTLIQMFAGKGAGGMTYNDHRRIDSRVTAEDRQNIKNDTLEAMLALMR